MNAPGGQAPAVTADVEREVERYGVLAEPSGRDLQALVDLAAQVFDVPFAAINIITSSSQHQVAAAGFAPSVCARSDSMCAAVVAEPSTVVVADARLDPRFADNPFVTGLIGSVRFYASAPLVAPSGVPIGRLCVFDEQPRRSTPQQHEALVTLAGRVMDALELRLKNQQVEDSLAELTRTRDELRRSNAALLDFASQVSHDLRNPLMAVRANAELLAEEPAVAGEPDLVAVVQRITEAVEDMTAMVSKVLRHASEGGRPQEGSADLAEVTRRVLRDLEPQVRDSGATVSVGPLPTVAGEPDLLYSVLLNLLTNSLKFTRPGVPAVVSVEATPADGCWRLTVTDNGVGVPAGEERSVFLPYVRAQTGRDRSDGHGIGLATVHRIVTSHGGRVGLGPAPGGGTTVWLELPAAGPLDGPGEGPQRR